MTDYRSRIIRALLVPADPATKIGAIQSKSIEAWTEAAGFRWMNFIRGTLPAQEHDFVMMVDDEGHQRRKAWNARAQFLSGYPIHHPIIGDAVFLSEGYVDDGYDATDLSVKAEAWLTDPTRGEEYEGWKISGNIVLYANAYSIDYPLPR